MVTANGSLAGKREWGWKQEERITTEAVLDTRKVTRVYTHSKPLPKILVKLSLVFMLYALIFVFFCIKISVLGYQTVGLEKDISNLENVNYRIEYEIAQLTSLDYIEQVAINELDMIKPEQRVKVLIPLAAADPELTERLDSIELGEKEKTLRKIYNNLVLMAERKF